MPSAMAASKWLRIATGTDSTGYQRREGSQVILVIMHDTPIPQTLSHKVLKCVAKAAVDSAAHADVSRSLSARAGQGRHELLPAPITQLNVSDLCYSDRGTVAREISARV